MKKAILTLLLALPMSLFAQKFAHFNSGDIVQAMPEFATAQTELQAMAKQYDDEYKRMQDEFQTKGQEYEKNQATMVDAVKQRREQELQDLYQRIQQYEANSRQEMQKAQQEKLGAINEKVLKAVKEIGTAGSYVYIMDTTSGIPFINEALSTDITAQLKAKLGIK